jgi:Ca2+-binding RTX toxin-like protein
MATFIFGQDQGAATSALAVTFLAFESLGQQPLQFTRTDTNYVASDGSGTTISYSGQNFAYSGNTLVGGTVQTISLDSNGQNFFAGSGLSLSVAQVTSIPSLTDRMFFEFSGNDLLQAPSNFAINNYFAAGAGNDTVTGGLGNDTLLGNQGDDFLLGNQDNDVVVGGQGSDIVVGGQGSDVCYGNEANDIVLGNESNDLILGGQGDDTIYGGQGADTIYGNEGNDILYGNEGADRLVFGANNGADRVFGFSQAEGDRLALGNASYSVADGANGAIISYSGGTIELVGISASAVSTNFFFFETRA